MTTQKTTKKSAKNTNNADQNKKETERRKSTRFDIAQFVEVSFTKENFIKAEGINISESGILCETAEPPEPYAQIYLLLPTPDGKETFELEGVVVRAEKVKSKYHVGVEFTHLYDEDKKMIRKILKAASG